jgi:tetratricopeptide (TPR) repeat protein
MAGEISMAERSRRAEILEPVFAAVRAGDLGTAGRLAHAALGQGLEHPVLLNLRALEHEEAGRFGQALDDLRRAHFLSPEDFSILNACGLCLARMERREEALRCYDQALALEPNFGPGWFNRGWVLERMGETAEAARSYAKAAEINPENAQAWANLAALDARRGDAEAVSEHAERALAAQPGHPTAVLALADSDVFEPLGAERRLRELLAGTLTLFDRAQALGQLGDALDALDRSAEAFAAYAQSNALFREELAPRFESPGQPTVADTVQWLTSWASALPSRAWRGQSADRSEAGETAHVFLLGFPRSGTTLIESALAKHPDVVSLEERDTLQRAVLAFMNDPGDLARLASASSRELTALRRDYWAIVRKFGIVPAGKIFIDKNPFNTLKLPVIDRLFPDARIVFSVRDPRDVVLSCFRRRFGINPSTYEFLDLERTAANYAGVMALAELLETKLELNEHRLFYERLVADFAGETRAVCEFIGAGWRDDLIDFADRARRGRVASASGAQIARGLYRGGAGQWRRYRDQLAPVLPILAPWIERFGYPPD